MGKGSSIIAVIALIIGLGAGGFIIYDNYFVTPPIIPKENQYYDYSISVLYMPSSEAWGFISPINIDFEVHSGQKVYFSFIAEVNFDDSSNPNSYIRIGFYVDGIRWSFPEVYVRRYNIDDANGLRMSVSLQHYNTTISSGFHNVTLTYQGDSTADSIRSCTLFIQTFN